MKIYVVTLHKSYIDLSKEDLFGVGDQHPMKICKVFDNYQQALTCFDEIIEKETDKHCISKKDDTIEYSEFNNELFMHNKTTKYKEVLIRHTELDAFKIIVSIVEMEVSK